MVSDQAEIAANGIPAKPKQEWPEHLVSWPEMGSIERMIIPVDIPAGVSPSSY
jgi:hypothetical protein